MAERKSLKSRTYLAVFAALVLLGLAVRLLPAPAETVWHRVYDFCGLGDFSDCADSSPFSVHVLDVGKADSLLLESGNSFLLVDGGTPDRGEEVVSYLQRRGASKLEYVVNTHPDEDHVGGLKYVIDAFPIDHYLAPEIPAALVPSDEAYRNTQQALAWKGLHAETPKPGTEFAVGRMKIRVLGPLREGNSTNNNSIVLRVSCGSVRFLLVGDAEKEEESDLLASGEDLSADVLKVGHHGSRTATSQKFLDAVKPKYAAISTAWDRNKLPNSDVLNRLFDAGTKIYRTDVSGTLIFLTDGTKLSVVTQKS